jgi:Ca-activated chloride channel family protein
VDHGNHAKEKIFKKFQAYMLSPAVQRRLQGLGRRTGAIGLSAGTASKALFNPAWGIDLTRVLQPVRLPSAAVINQALNLYQEAFRKPSFTVYVLDFSGSMGSNGGEDQLKTAMRTLLTQNLAKTYFLQATNRDRNVVIPFSDAVEGVWRVDGNNPAALQSLYAKVNNLSAGGDTAIFSGIETAYQQLQALRYEGYQPAIILMTDGQNNSGISFDSLKSYIASHGLGGIPVYALMFGAADPSQLTQLTNFTSGKLFDGRKDLISAFRDAKGYND